MLHWKTNMLTPSVVTISIPFYSDLDLLRLAVESVVAQSSPYWRLIVCDDHDEVSGVQDLCDSFGDSRVKCFRNKKNLGMARNWNRCLDVADTDLVALLHADDELLPNYVDYMSTAAREFPKAVALYCRTRIINRLGRRRFSIPDAAKSMLQPNGSEPTTLSGEQSVAALLRGNFIMCPTLCYRKSILRARRFKTEWQFVQDLELTTRLLMEGETIVGLPEKLYAYRRHKDNATAKYTKNLLRFEEEFEFYEKLASQLREVAWNRAAEIAQHAKIIKLHMAFQTVRDVATFHPKLAWTKWRLLRQHCFGSRPKEPRESP